MYHHDFLVSTLSTRGADRQHETLEFVYNYNVQRLFHHHGRDYVDLV